MIVYPWYFGVSFDYYYRGPAAWTTLPSLADHRSHRYDLLKEKLASEEPIEDVRQRALATLAAGGRVWVVGPLPPAQPGETTPPTLPPAPQSSTGWDDVPYIFAWGRQFDLFLQGRGILLEKAEFHSPGRISVYEDAELLKSK